LTALILFFSFFEEGERLSNSRSSQSAWAALNFRNAIRIFANKFAFGFGAVGFVAFPIAFGFFANRFTFWFRSLAMSNAMRLFANSYALRAIKHFASFIRAFDFTFWFFAFDVANCVFRLGAGSMALRRFADWIANSRAMGIIAFP
jgi:hypothetical protein